MRALHIEIERKVCVLSDLIIVHNKGGSILIRSNSIYRRPLQFHSPGPSFVDRQQISQDLIVQGSHCGATTRTFSTNRLFVNIVISLHETNLEGSGV